MTSSRRKYYAYLLVGDSRTVFTGEVHDLHLDVHRHRTKESPGRHDPKRLVYYEMFTDRETAMSRAKEIKGWDRKKKLELISSVNPELTDLIEPSGIRPLFGES